MAETPLDIDRIVQEVVRQLTLLGTPAVAAAPAGGAKMVISGSSPHPGPLPTMLRTVPGEGDLKVKPRVDPTSDPHLILTERVVTLKHVEGRLNGIRKLIVPPRAVVTPAVRDELDRLRISLAYQDPRGPAVPAGSLRLVLVAARLKHFDPAALINALQDQAALVVPHALDCLIASSNLLAHQVSQAKTLGLLLTRHTASAMCLANRLPGVRAVHGTSVAAASAAAMAVGANVLVADPQAVGPLALKQMVTEFCRGGVRACPAVFQQQLG